jgi:hypothetical protein
MRLPASFLAKITVGKSSRTYRHGESVFLQGDLGDAVFYLHRGKVVPGKRRSPCDVADGSSL